MAQFIPGLMFGGFGLRKRMPANLFIKHTTNNTVRATAYQQQAACRSLPTLAD